MSVAVGLSRRRVFVFLDSVKFDRIAGVASSEASTLHPPNGGLRRVDDRIARVGNSVTFWCFGQRDRSTGPEFRVLRSCIGPSRSICRALAIGLAT